MNGANNGNYGTPVPYDNRTLFPTPQPGQAAPQPPQKRSGGGGMAVIMFLAMLVPCGILGWMVYSQNDKIAALQDSNTVEDTFEVAHLTAQVDALKQQAAGLKAGTGTINSGIGKLLSERDAKMTEIETLLTTTKRGGPKVPDAIKTVPAEWDDATRASLSTDVEQIDALRQSIIRGTAPPVIAPAPEAEPEDSTQSEEQ